MHYAMLEMVLCRLQKNYFNGVINLTLIKKTTY